MQSEVRITKITTKGNNSKKVCQGVSRVYHLLMLETILFGARSRRRKITPSHILTNFEYFIHFNLQNAVCMFCTNVVVDLFFTPIGGSPEGIQCYGQGDRPPSGDGTQTVPYLKVKHPLFLGRGDHIRTYARAYLQNLKKIFIFLLFVCL